MPAALLPACTSGVARAPAPWTEPVRSDRILEKESDVARGAHPRAIEAARGGSLQCPFPDECEPSVALVSVVSGEGVNRCSGVLISPDRVLTNEHCVSGALSLTGLDSRGEDLPCADSIFVHFAATPGLPEHHASCRRVERRSLPLDGAPRGPGMDYAILVLDRELSGRAPAPTLRRPIQDRETVRIVRVQMQGSSRGGSPTRLSGAQEVLICGVALGTYSYPSLDSPDFDLMTLGDCALQAGNSGAPVLNASGELGGIVQGFFSLRKEEVQNPELLAHLLDSSYGQVGIATRLDCIPGLSGRGDPSCPRAPPLSGMNLSEYLEKFSKALLPGAPQAADGLVWRELEGTAPFARVRVMSPACGREEASLRLSSLRYRQGINRELLAEWRLENESSGEISFLRSTGSRYLSDSGLSFDLPACR